MNEQRFDKVDTIIRGHNADPERLIPILHAIQQECRYLPEPALTSVAKALHVSLARVFGVATFFAHFALKPKGKYVIKICDGTACHVKGSMNLYDTIKKALKLKDEQSTSDDLLFTLETVSCLGACGLAPAMIINEDVYGQMTPQKVSEVITGIMKREAEASK